MPFTVAHAAVAPPLARLTAGRLPASALAIGAMAPDLEYLVFLETRRTVGHLPLGLLTFCLPVSLVLLAVWHGLVKRPLGELVPDRWAHLSAAMARPFPFRSWSARIGTVVAILVGAASHLALDAFTHPDGAFVTRIELLRRTVPRAGLPLYSALQYAGGLLGMLVLTLAIAVWAANQPRVRVALPPARQRLAIVAAISVFALGISVLNVGRTFADGVTGPKSLLIAGVLGLMTGGGIAVTAYAATRRHSPG